MPDYELWSSVEEYTKVKFETKLKYAIREKINYGSQWMSSFSLADLSDFAKKIGIDVDACNPVINEIN